MRSLHVRVKTVCFVLCLPLPGICKYLENISVRALFSHPCLCPLVFPAVSGGNPYQTLVFTSSCFDCSILLTLCYLISCGPNVSKDLVEGLQIEVTDFDS